MRRGVIALALPVALGIIACGEGVVPPTAVTRDPEPLFAKKGTGVVLESVTGLTLPLLGVDLGTVEISQAVITKVKPIEDIVGTLVGIEVKGVLELTGGVLGTDVVRENFKTEVTVTPGGPGRCNVVTLDLAPIRVKVLGETAFVDVPAASVTGDASGLVGLLCELGNLLGGGLPT